MKGQLALFTQPTPPSAPAPALVVCWSGVTRAGVTTSGVLDNLDELDGFVRARYRARWQFLEITVAGQVVAAIIPDPDRPARRSLWIEGTRP